MSRVRVRDYEDVDEASWLRCRVLGFLGSSYYDDVKTERTRFDGEALRLVAVHPRPSGTTTPGPEEVVGILDVELVPPEGASAHPTATIDTVAVHPDHARRGIAGRLLEAALPRLAAAGVAVLDAWTREDPPANAWYRRHGFSVVQEYLHVYRTWDEPSEGFATPEELTLPVQAFLHASLEDEDAVRARFARVYRCRRYLRRLGEEGR